MWKTPEEHETAAAMYDPAEKNILSGIREFLKDPAGAVEARAAASNQTGQAGQTGQAPAWTPPFSLADRLAEQERLGKGLPGFTPRLLTVAEADGLFAPLSDAELSAGEKLGRLTAGLSKYGELADRALDELGLPDRATAAVRQAMENPGRSYVAALAGELLRASLSFEPDAERRVEMIEKKLAESRAVFPVRQLSTRADAGVLSDAGGHQPVEPLPGTLPTPADAKGQNIQMDAERSSGEDSPGAVDEEAETLRRRFLEADDAGKEVLLDDVFSEHGNLTGIQRLRDAGIYDQLYQYANEPTPSPAAAGGQESPTRRERVFAPYVSGYARMAMGGTRGDQRFPGYSDKNGEFNLTDPANEHLQDGSFAALKQSPHYDAWVALRNQYWDKANSKERLILDLPIIEAEIAGRDGAGIKEGWHEAAWQIMQWTTGPAGTEREKNAHREISWDIVDATPRGKKAHEAMRDPKNLFTENAKTGILSQLEADGKLKPGAKFDYTQGEMQDWHKGHFQHQTITDWDIVKDFPSPRAEGQLASLGRFTVYAVPKGFVSEDGKEVHITGVGLSIRDSFDFEDSQYLGFWDRQGKSFSALPGVGPVYLDNDHFREFREKSGFGADYFVYTPMDTADFTKHEVITIQSIKK